MITSYGAMHFANAPMLTLLGIHEGDGRSSGSPRAAGLKTAIQPGGQVELLAQGLA